MVLQGGGPRGPTSRHFVAVVDPPDSRECALLSSAPSSLIGASSIAHSVPLDGGPALMLSRPFHAGSEKQGTTRRVEDLRNFQTRHVENIVWAWGKLAFKHRVFLRDSVAARMAPVSATGVGGGLSHPPRERPVL